MKKLVYLLMLLFFIAPKAQAYTFTWTGLGFSTSWNNAANWSSTNPGLFPVPTANDDVVIQPILLGGLINLISYPTISSSTTAQCKSLTFLADNPLYLSNNTSITLTVNGTLTIGGPIIQSFKTVNGNTSVLLTGTGSVSCTSFTLGDGSTLPSSAGTNLSTFKTNLAQLTVSGAVTVNSFGDATHINNGTFSVVNDLNTNTNITVGSLAIVSPSTTAVSNINLNNANSSTSAYNINLKLTGPDPFALPTTPRGAIDLYNTTIVSPNTAINPGRIKVEYAATSGTEQKIYTNSLSGLDTSPALYQDIAFSGSITKKFNSGTATIDGDWTSQGTLVNATANSPIITFKGANQTLTDVVTNGTRGVVFKTVNFTGTGTKTMLGSTGKTSAFTISPKGVLTIQSAITLTVGSNASLTLLSDGTGDATIAAIPTGASVTGTVNVQRFFKNGTIAANTRNYRLLSSAVNTGGATLLNYLSNNPGLFTGGPNGSTNGFTVANPNPTIYLYKENLPISNASFNSGNFKGLTNITGSALKVYNNNATADTTITLYPANGFMLFYTGNNVNNLTNKQTKINGIYANPDSSTTTAPGTLNQGTITTKLWWNSSTTLSHTKTNYNLVGNPYPSAIDWDKFSNSSSSAAIYGLGLSTSIYVFNYTNKNYGIYQAGTSTGIGTNNATRFIASGQGFFVETTSTGALLTFQETAKTNNQPASLGQSSYLLMGLPVQAAVSPQYLRVRLAKDSVNYDESILMFESDASNNYEIGKDAARLDGIGNVATLATYDAAKTQLLAINHLHSINAATRVKLYAGMTGAVSLDTLSFSGLSSLDKRFDIFLIDHYKKDSLQINLYNKYMFNIRPDSAASFGADRFELVFHPKGDYSYRLLSFTGKPANSTIELNWQTEREQDLTSFTIQKADGKYTYMPVYNLQSDGNGKYTYVDKTPVAGANHYRLIQNDPFGKISSTDLTVNFTAPTTSEQQALMIYPNPVATQMSVKINAPEVPTYVSLKVLNLNGQTLIRSVQSSENIQQNTSTLMPGVYIVEVTNDQTKQLIGRTKITKP